MLRFLGTLVVCSVVQIAAAENTFVGDKPLNNDAPSSAKSAVPETDDREFKPPLGFKIMKRGNLVVYCQDDTTIGTRLKTVKCYDEAGLRGYLLALDSRQRFPLLDAR